MTRFTALTILLFLCQVAPAQDRLPLLENADSLHRTRFWVTLGGGTAIYSGISVALWETWYKGYELTGMHAFDDWNEWENVDKAGHLFTAYNEANWSFQGALWTGMDRRKAMWTGVGVGMLLQSTIEVMDGFSAKWGFSWYDMGFNVLGVGLFAGQELLWEEQRIVCKVSANFPEYPTALIQSTDGQAFSSLAQRAEDLYGRPFYQRFLKDYNAQVNWLSFNLHSFLIRKEESRFPQWLNVAVGYGAENMFAGYETFWEEDGRVFQVDNELYPRYSQVFLSFDVDLRRIPTRHRALRTAFGVLNFIKIPSPALEINSLGKVRGHWFY